MNLHKKNKYGPILNFGLCVFVITMILCNVGCIRKPKDEKKDIQYGDLLINGKNYLTVKIGDQWWMAENLTTSVYSNSTVIPIIDGADESGWANLQSDAKDKGYAYNYNWYAAESDSLSIAPPGWHVPSDDDWKKLEQELGMNTEQTNEHGWRGNDEGDQLKLDNNHTWPAYDQNTVWGMNKSGFSAKPSECRMFSGNYGEKGTAFFWTSSEGPGNTAYYRYLDYKKSTIFRSYASKNYGFCIRLVKNE